LFSALESQAKSLRVLIVQSLPMNDKSYRSLASS
jgi:hypothetical protein